MDTTVLLNALVSVLIAVGGVTGTMYAAKLARRSQLQSQASSDHNADRDQVQEDLQKLREEFDRLVARTNAREARDDRKIRYQEQIIRHLDDEINELRKLMTDVGILPPPRKAWPSYPGEWMEDRT